MKYTVESLRRTRARQMYIGWVRYMEKVRSHLDKALQDLDTIEKRTNFERTVIDDARNYVATCIDKSDTHRYLLGRLALLGTSTARRG